MNSDSRNWMKLGCLILVGLFGINATAPCAESEFSLKSMATSEDWAFFSQMSPEQKRAIWEKKNHGNLKNAHWTWRLALLRGCDDSNGSVKAGQYCSQVLKQGLRDRALVVRMESAEILSKQASNMNTELEKAFIDALGNKWNSRGNKSNFAFRRILFSAYQTGIPSIQLAAKEIASANANNKKYWDRITQR